MELVPNYWSVLDEGFLRILVEARSYRVTTGPVVTDSARLIVLSLHISLSQVVLLWSSAAL